MRNRIKASLMLMTFVGILSVCSAVAFADTVIVTGSHRPYFHSGAGPVASVFYFIGDVVVLPFRLIGDLFS